MPSSPLPAPLDDRRVATLALATGDLGVQRGQSRRPEAAECCKPFIDSAQRIGIDRVEPTCPVGTYGRVTVVAQDAEVLGHRRLADSELAADRLRQLSGRPFPVREQLEQSPSDRVAEDVECVHHSYISLTTYISQDANSLDVPNEKRPAGRRVER